MTISLPGLSVDIHSIYRECSTELIVFLHGLGCSGSSFHKVWESDALGSYSILCMDYVGHGDSSMSHDFSYSLEDHARVCAAVIKKFKNQPIHLVGHSLGGAIALLLPESIRESVISLTNVEGNLNPEDCDFGSRRAAEASFEKFRSEILPEFRKSSKTWRDSGLELVDAKAFYQTAISLVRWSDNLKLLDAFHSWPGKKVYVYGSKNSKAKTVGTVRGINCVEISDAGHFVMTDNPDEFYSALFKFIR